jgi:ABC-type glycerol-3-phosphate transport system substrate-binding protein
MIKRPLLYLLAIAFLLAACARNKTPAYKGDPATITFACMDYQRSVYEPLVEGFHAANPNIRVQLVSADEASGMQRQGSTVTSSGQELERLAAYADTFVWFANLRPTDHWFLLDLQPFVQDSSFPATDFYPGTLGLFRQQGGLYGLPAEITLHLIFYDKDLFDRAGVPYPRIGWTWDDFLDAASRLTEWEGDTVIRYGAAARVHFLLAMMQQHGVSLWDDRVDPPHPLFDTPEVARVLRRYTDMILTDRVMAGRETMGIGEIASLIDEGKVAMWSDFAHSRPYHAARKNLGIAPFPEGVAAANPRSAYGFYASAGTAHPEAAWRWLTYLSETYQPPSFMEGMLPARRSVTGQVGWWKALDKETKAVFEYALDHPATNDTAMNQLIWRAANRVLEDGASVEDALAETQSEALRRQSELAAATPPPLRPVATPQPTPAKVQTVITFAPSPDADLSTYRELAAAYQEAHPDVRIEVIPVPVDLAELTAIADCFGSTFSAQAPGVRQHIRSLQPLLEADADFPPGDFYPQFLAACQGDGELWCLPYQADALMVYYNRNLLAESDVAPPAAGWSVDDWLDAVAALSTEDHYGFTTYEGAYGDLIFGLERLGARLVDDARDPPRPTLDDPTVVAALTRYADRFHPQPLSPGTPSTQNGWPDTMVMGNHPEGVQRQGVAMWIDSIGLHAYAPPLLYPVGVAPLPTGARASTEFALRAYYISAGTGEAEACWQWCAFLSGRPETVRLLPARRSVAESFAWQQQVSPADLPAYLATLEYDDASILRLRWKIRWLAYAYPWLDEAFQATVRGANGAQALATAQAKAEELVACLEETGGFSDNEQLRACARQVDPDYPL